MNKITFEGLNIIRPIVFFDVETTGLTIGEDRIIEICMIKCNPDSSVDEFYSKFNPEGKKSCQEAFEKHKISDDELKSCPYFKDKAKEILAFIKDCDLGGYNSMRFDIPILVDEFLRCGIYYNTLNLSIIDSYSILAKMEPRKLENVYEKYTGKKLEDAHSAKSDILATIEIFQKQLEIYEDLEKDISLISKMIKEDTSNVDTQGKLKIKDGKIIFTFGKYKDVCIEDVFLKDKGYLMWIIDKSDLSRELKFFVNRFYKKMINK